MDDIEQYENRQKFEHGLINRRLTWLLTSQTILFAALAILFKVDVPFETENWPQYLESLKNIISCLGISISIMILIGVLMGLSAKIMLRFDYNKKHPFNKRQLGVRNWITYIAFVPDIAIPLFFIWAWLEINILGFS